MYRSLFVAALLAVTTVHAQLNISFVGRLDYQQLRNSNLSNLWGYTDEAGNEYAIVGVNGSGANNPGGVSVVALGDGTNPQEIFFYPGPTSIWREVKVWGDHAYITTEANSGGITIVDLSPLPESTALTATVWEAPDWNTSHSLFIDENGRLYIHGADRGNGGVIMYDLTQDPWNPVEVGEFDNWYCHDSFARGDTLYAAHILDGFLTIVDVSNPASPVLLGTRETSSTFTHNVWLDDSGDYLFTTDERSNAYVDAYNISDPTDIEFLDKLRSDGGSGAVPHNTYWLNDYLVTSYYTFGVTIYDAQRPGNLVEVGHYDTSPFTGDGFRGAWGVYPFFPSGRLIISDIEQGLFVLAPNYQRACWLEGTIRNSANGIPVGNATVSLETATETAVTGIDGRYGKGVAANGTYTLQVSAPGFLPATITGVVMVQGEVTVQDVELVPLVPFDLVGRVVDAATNEGVANAPVRIENADFTLNTTTNATGAFTFPGFFPGVYDVKAAAWGWNGFCETDRSLLPGNGELVIALPAGYADDFEFDLGWTVTATANLGAWERGVPQGTTFNNNTSNPGEDATGDCGDQAYVTGNAGGQAGADDLDDGNTILTSPVFDLTNVWAPHVRYQRWFFNSGGSGAPNDRMRISLDNGLTTVVLEELTAGASSSNWVARDVAVEQFIQPTSTMRLVVFITDDAPGHLVEGGFDRFEVVSMSPTAVEDQSGPGDLIAYPNPTEGRFTVEYRGGGNGLLHVLDALGREVVSSIRMAGAPVIMQLDAPAGTYMVRFVADDGSVRVSRLVLQP